MVWRGVVDARLKTALGVGLVGGLALLAFALSQSPVSVARTNTAASTFVAAGKARVSACQPDEALPSGTSAIRLGVETFIGPRVAVEAVAGGHVIAHGERGSGWTAGAVTVPVHPLPVAKSGVELCFTLFLNGHETAILVGEPTTGARAARAGGRPLPGRVRVEYLRPGGSSWWSLIPRVARRMGLGHAWPGTWSVLLVLALMGGVALLCSRLILRELP